MSTPDQKAAAAEHAAALRQIADLIEAHPQFSKYVAFVLEHRFTAYIVRAEDHPRRVLSEFYRAATAAGARVSLVNDDDLCKVDAVFGSATFGLHATAEAMGDLPAPKFEPLVIQDADGADA